MKKAGGEMGALSLQTLFENCFLKDMDLHRRINTCRETEMEPLEVYSSDKRTQLIEVRDKSGNAFICDAGELKDPKHATAEELRNCIDESRVPQPYGGD